MVLEDEKPEVFLTMLDYMYTNCCTLTIDLCPDVLSNAIEYGLDGLRKIACRFMADCLSIESAAIIFQSAILHDQKELKKVKNSRICVHQSPCPSHCDKILTRLLYLSQKTTSLTLIQLMLSQFLPSTYQPYSFRDPTIC